MKIIKMITKYRKYEPNKKTMERLDFPIYTFIELMHPWAVSNMH